MSLASSRHSYLSVASSSSHGSLNRLAEDEESAYASAINFAALYEHGYPVSRPHSFFVLSILFSVVFIVRIYRICICIYFVPQRLPLLEPLVEPVPSLEMGRVASGMASGIKFLPSTHLLNTD
jgi:hypothetical protein